MVHREMKLLKASQHQVFLLLHVFFYCYMQAGLSWQVSMVMHKFEANKNKKCYKHYGSTSDLRGSKPVLAYQTRRKWETRCAMNA